jgi:uncharacterized protein DUF2867
VDRSLRIHRSSRASALDRDADDVWSVVASGTDGPHWYVDALPLVVRGAVDRLLGGAGRRWPPPGRAELRAGDTVGFWRVTRAADRGLELEADVRSPGRVRLTTRVESTGPGRSVVRQTVGFDPDGLAGQLYMLADLPSREVVVELVHRRLLAELDEG